MYGIVIHTKKILVKIILVFLSNLIISSCNRFANNEIFADTGLRYSADSVKMDMSIFSCKDFYRITDTIDLECKTLYLPPNVSLDIRRGLIKNGAIVGNNTRLIYKNAGFDRVQIRGSWKVKNIHTKLFKDLSYENSLKDVFALTNPKIDNTVTIEKGKYQVTALSQDDACLNLCSKTNVKLLGDIILTPNDYPMYSIIKTIGNDIMITGPGTIIGDKRSHNGTDGEWGMGVSIMGGKRIKLKNITIKDCWGDCIYITKKAEKVSIENCSLDNSRRQGISVISAQDVVINKCRISDIGGTSPGYAIDIEPNKSDTVQLVIIDSVIIHGCRGGILTYGKAIDSSIGSVFIKNCVIEQIETSPLNFKTTNNIVVNNCSIASFRRKQAVVFVDVNNVKVKRIRINGKKVNSMEDSRVVVDGIVKSKILN